MIFRFLPLLVGLATAGAAGPPHPTVSAKLAFEGVAADQKNEIELIALGRKPPGRIVPFSGGSVTVRLAPGKYVFRTRAVDRRGVPGEWGELTEIEIKPKPAKPVARKEPVNADPRTGKARVGLGWEAAEGAAKYRVHLHDEENAIVATAETARTAHELELGPGRYAWTVVPVSAGGTEGAASAPSVLEIQGPRLSVPEVAERRGRTLVIRGATAARELYYRLEHRKFEAEAWAPLGEFAAPTAERIDLPPDLATGQYRAHITARASHWVESGAKIYEFVIKPTEL